MEVGESRFQESDSPVLCIVVRAMYVSFKLDLKTKNETNNNNNKNIY